MAAIVFPANPSNAQTFTASNGTTYVYNSASGYWGVQVTAGNGAVSISDTAPSNPVTGQQWFNSTTLRTYIYYNSQWIISNPVGLQGATGASGGAASVTVYADTASLPLSGNDTGDQAFVTSNNRLYIWNGSGWYNISLVNTAPSIDAGVDTSYDLATDGTPTVITITASDVEEIPLTYSYSVTSGTLGTTATVSQESNVFTITPGTTDPDDAGTFSLTFTVSDGINTDTATAGFTLTFSAPASGVLFTTVGSHSWTAPDGVTSVSVVCIGGGGGGGGTLGWTGQNPSGGGGGGGGGLGYKNNISVTPGNTYTVVVGDGGNGTGGSANSLARADSGGDSYFIDTTTVRGIGGQGGVGGNSDAYSDYGSGGGTGGGYVGDGGGSGGNGGNGSRSNRQAGGGGGAGGYSGNGGNSGQAGSGGGAGGGAGTSGGSAAYAGGGVNPNGEGASGAASSAGGNGGSGGADGLQGTSSTTTTRGGEYGGGGPGNATPTTQNLQGNKGAPGCVRIVWNGTDRTFPTTLVGTADSTDAETTV